MGQVETARRVREKPEFQFSDHIKSYITIFISVAVWKRGRRGGCCRRTKYIGKPRHALTSPQKKHVRLIRDIAQACT
jgi:hypothetical protein